jgi:hypothetical protein
MESAGVSVGFSASEVSRRALICSGLPSRAGAHLAPAVGLSRVDLSDEVGAG